MGRRHLKVGDKVYYDDEDKSKTGTVSQYVYPHFHPDGFVEVVDEANEVVCYGNADSEIKKVK